MNTHLRMIYNIHQPLQGKHLLTRGKSDLMWFATVFPGGLLRMTTKQYVLILGLYTHTQWQEVTLRLTQCPFWDLPVVKGQLLQVVDIYTNLKKKYVSAKILTSCHHNYTGVKRHCFHRHTHYSVEVSKHKMAKTHLYAPRFCYCEMYITVTYGECSPTKINKSRYFVLHINKQIY